MRHPLPHPARLATHATWLTALLLTSASALAAGEEVHQKAKAQCSPARFAVAALAKGAQPEGDCAAEAATLAAGKRTP